MQKVTIYTDGSCSGNPGPGGWGAILMYKQTKRELSGGAHDTTNNRMELTAAIEALKLLNRPCQVELYSDSKYLVDAMTRGWVTTWKAHGWRKADKKPALNVELWEELLRLCETHRVEFCWVKGHADTEYNNRCDELARMETEKHR